MIECCPNCLARGISTFYEVGPIPVHSCLMLSDRQAAVDFPRGELALGFCPSCGFVFNTRFDPQAQAYSNAYEDQQSFSPRFRAFQTAQVNWLIDRYGVRNKTVLEIGCSKGDFLIELCRAGGNRGIGVDPSAIPGRVETGPDVDVRFIADYYSEKYTDIACDVVCCRHTLEHIHATHEFIATVRRAIGDRPETLVFFEVPDVGRVLREQAFWDIYYEHCSYFSLGSLARVFRANNFEVIELAKDYDDQYLLLVARPAEGPTKSHLPEEEDLAELTRDVEQFRTGVQRRLEQLGSMARALAAKGRKAAVWGSGSKCVSFLSTLGLGEEIQAIVDINPHRHGRYLAGVGRRVDSPESLARVRPEVIFIMNSIYRDEIAEQVARLGLSAELVPI